jgi:ABC-type polysaccharide/polyol phosphate export permease
LWSVKSINAAVVAVFATFMFCMVGVALGSRIANVGTVAMVCNLIYLPLVMLNDLTFRTWNLPKSVEYIVAILPVREIASILREILFGETSLGSQMWLFSVLLLWIIALAAVIHCTFRWYA